MSNEAKAKRDYSDVEEAADIKLTHEELSKVSGGKLYEALHNGTHIPKVIIELSRPSAS